MNIPPLCIILDCSIQTGKKGENEILLYSYNFLKKLSWPEHLKKIPDIFIKYRERMDGSGYPARLKEKAIPLLSRILGFAEEFDNLTSGLFCDDVSPYTVEKALAKMALSDTGNSAFDPEIINLFREKENI